MLYVYYKHNMTACGLQDTGVANIVDATGAAIWASNAAVAPAGGGGGGGAVGGGGAAGVML
jgi:hypothetical protein